MPGWTHKKRLAVEKAFYQYLDRCFIFSKDSTGSLCLGEHLYRGQRDTITLIFDALEQDIHNVYILKSRQLGISTLIRALTAFLLGIHNGLKGAIVFDTSQNKDESRAELTTMIQELPGSIKFPTIISDNRAGLTLANRSKILFMSAGVRKNKASGTLGRSVGLSLAHCSELCSWDNDEGLEAFRNSLSDVNPDRLYIYESTARGFNRWNEMWQEAREDPGHCRCIFLGWYTKESQRIAHDTPDFQIYGMQAPTDREFKKIDEVERLYGYQIDQEQLAWIRRHSDPSAIRDNNDEMLEYEPEKERLQEQPWTEQDAFQQTGAKFFAAETLTDMTNKYGSDKYKRYHYKPGSDFADTKVYQGFNAKETELKVWQEPDTDAFYVMGIDPAYGENEHNDRSAIQICRCYSDCIEQVAEYASPLITTRQLAWVIASLLGWYGAGNEIRYILELNGPGGAVWNELQMLKYKIENDRSARRDLEERGLKRIFQNVKTYIYTRNDSMGAGYNYHFVTTTRLKVALLERLRDFASNGVLRVKSLATIMEMNKIARDGDSIGAEGSGKDDRVIAMAFAAHCWETKMQKFLISNNKTRNAEIAKKRNSIMDQVNLFQENQLQMFFARKKAARVTDHRMLQRLAWRGR